VLDALEVDLGDHVEDLLRRGALLDRSAIAIVTKSKWSVPPGMWIARPNGRHGGAGRRPLPLRAGARAARSRAAGMPAAWLN
jgi:hypothetical protein